jgi:hypothetical protein
MPQSCSNVSALHNKRLRRAALHRCTSSRILNTETGKVAQALRQP